MTTIPGRFTGRAFRAMAGSVLLLVAAFTARAGEAAATREAFRLRVVGGLAGVSQYLLHEEPFWSRDLARLTGGRYAADIVPFDRAGFPGQDMLTLIRLGVVPFGTALLGPASAQYPELAAPDLAGLASDVGTLRKVVEAFRPTLARLMRERHGTELLAVYMYPAQVVVCREPLGGLKDLAGRRTRVSSSTQSDLVRAVGSVPVLIPFSEVTASMRSKAVDCAVTGAVSGAAIGLPQVATTVYAQPISWGLAVFGANLGVWRSLPEELRTLLMRQLPVLEASIWDEAERQSTFERACTTARPCAPGTLDAMRVVHPSAEDQRLRQSLFEQQVLPAWVDRCGPECVAIWNTTIAPVVGARASERR